MSRRPSSSFNRDVSHVGSRAGRDGRTDGRTARCESSSLTLLWFSRCCFYSLLCVSGTHREVFRRAAPAAAAAGRTRHVFCPHVKRWSLWSCGMTKKKKKLESFFSWQLLKGKLRWKRSFTVTGEITSESRYISNCLQLKCMAGFIGTHV